MTSFGPALPLPRRRTRNRRLTATSRAVDRKRLWAARLRRLGAYSVGAFTLVATCAVCVYAWRATVDSRRMRVRSVQLSGNSRVSAAELTAYTGIELGQNLLDLDLDDIALRLRRHPWVAEAHVRRRLPDQVVVEVRERTPAILVSLGVVYLADAEGHPFKRLAASDGLELPVVTGLTRDDVQKQPDETAARLREALALASAFEAQGASSGRLDELHFDADLGWSILVSPGGDENLAYRANLGAEPAARLPAALAAVEEVRKAGHVPAVIFADGRKSPGRVQVRLRGAQETSSRTLVATSK
jgi:cell division protein FtsQ